jgi:hypothetical protein
MGNEANRKYYECLQKDQNQASIDNAVMTKIDSNIYLGNYKLENFVSNSD